MRVKVCRWKETGFREMEGEGNEGKVREREHLLLLSLLLLLLFWGCSTSRHLAMRMLGKGGRGGEKEIDWKDKCQMKTERDGMEGREVERCKERKVEGEW